MKHGATGSEKSSRTSQSPQMRLLRLFWSNDGTLAPTRCTSETIPMRSQISGVTNPFHDGTMSRKGQNGKSQPCGLLPSQHRQRRPGIPAQRPQPQRNTKAIPAVGRAGVIGGLSAVNQRAWEPRGQNPSPSPTGFSGTRSGEDSESRQIQRAATNESDLCLPRKHKHRQTGANDAD